MKYLLSLAAALLVLAGCTEDSEYDVPQEEIYRPEKNAFRAVEISGTSAYWGNFKLELAYDKELLESGLLTNDRQDTIGDISLTRNSDYLQYFIRDFVPSIDRDSIHRLDSTLTARHGAGNYKLWDSIPKTAQSIVEHMAFMYKDGRIKRCRSQYFVPGDGLDKTGDDFNTEYMLKSGVTHTYEYDAVDGICIDRIMHDIHNPEDPDLYRTELYKAELDFAGGLISRVSFFTAGGGENFSEKASFAYTYGNGRISAIKGNAPGREFSWNGSTVRMDTADGVVELELDGNGNTVRYKDSKGNDYRIRYEKGNGNLSIFTPFTEQIMNPFYIR